MVALVLVFFNFVFDCAGLTYGSCLVFSFSEFFFRAQLVPLMFQVRRKNSFVCENNDI